MKEINRRIAKKDALRKQILLEQLNQMSIGLENQKQRALDHEDTEAYFLVRANQELAASLAKKTFEAEKYK